MLSAALNSHSIEFGMRDTVNGGSVTEVFDAQALYWVICRREGVEIRQNGTSLYNSIYSADNEVFCNQHAYGISPIQCPVLHLRHRFDGDLASTYLKVFDRVWSTSSPLT
jgi:hypothetical protein